MRLMVPMNPFSPYFKVKCNEPIEPCDKNPDQALCKYKDQVDVYEVAAHLSVGPVVARHIGYRLYRGEYYSTQSDAHVSFTTDWDVDIISQFESTNNEMAVLTTYLTDVQGSIDPKTGNSLRKTRPIMCNTDYEGGPQGMHLRHLSQPERMPSVHGTPQLQPWWAAGYSFSRGHFVVNVPYGKFRSSFPSPLYRYCKKCSALCLQVLCLATMTKTQYSRLVPANDFPRGGNEYWNPWF